MAPAHCVPPRRILLHVNDFQNTELKNSIIITWKYSSWATNFTKTIFSLFHKILRYPQKCNISSRLHRQLTCSTGIEGKHLGTHVQKNHLYHSKLESSLQFLVRSLTSLMDFKALKVLLKILASFFFDNKFKFSTIFLLGSWSRRL